MGSRPGRPRFIVSVPKGGNDLFRGYLRMLEPIVIAAAGAGLFAGAIGGAHCAAMCGGIAGAIPIRPALRPAAQQGSAPLASAFTRNLAFNAGRIASYTVAGALAGSISSAAFVMHDTMVLRQLLFAVANLMLIALGLYLAGLWHGITALERGGAVLWRSDRDSTVASPSNATGIICGGVRATRQRLCRGHRKSPRDRS